MYNLDRKNLEFKIQNLNNKKKILFNSPYPLGYENVDIGEAFLYEGNKDKGIVFIHGLGSRNFEYLKYYPKNLSKQGITTIMLVLPFHETRQPDNKKISFLSGTAEKIEERFYQSVSDTLACVDFLESIGIKNIHIMGFSFGGMISTIAKALDNRLKKGILVVTGGNFEYITWRSVATKVLRVRYEDEGSCNPKRCNILHQNFDQVVENTNSLEDLYSLPSCFRYDPSIFAKKLNPDEILMFTALFDPFIPRKSSKDLWEKINRPKRYKIPSGHLTSHLWFKKFILKKTLEFLN